MKKESKHLIWNVNNLTGDTYNIWGNVSESIGTSSSSESSSLGTYHPQVVV